MVPNVLRFEAQFVFDNACGVASEIRKKVVLSEIEELPVDHVVADG